MKARYRHGKHDIGCDKVADPIINHPRDAIINLNSCAICGSDLPFFDDVIPSMEKGDVLGHGMTGEVVEISAEVTNLKVGDCVVVPFTIFYSECLFCKRGFYSGFEGSYSNHKLAEYPRVPYADIGPIKFPENLTDDQVLVHGLINKAAAIAANDLPECFDSGHTTHD